jgi:hypothetical protein
MLAGTIAADRVQRRMPSGTRSPISDSPEAGKRLLLCRSRRGTPRTARTPPTRSSGCGCSVGRDLGV